MNREFFVLISLVALVVATSGLIPASASAGQGEGLYDWSGRGYSGSNSYSSGGSYRSRYYQATVLTTSRRNEESPALITVSVPANATISFDGAKTTQGGTSRQFVSPPLSPGHEYVYDVQATWTMDGKQVSRTRRVTVHAGAVSTISFAPAQMASADAGKWMASR